MKTGIQIIVPTSIIFFAFLMHISCLANPPGQDKFLGLEDMEALLVDLAHSYDRMGEEDRIEYLVEFADRKFEMYREIMKRIEEDEHAFAYSISLIGKGETLQAEEVEFLDSVMDSEDFLERRQVINALLGTYRPSGRDEMYLTLLKRKEPSISYLGAKALEETSTDPNVLAEIHKLRAKWSLENGAFGRESTVWLDNAIQEITQRVELLSNESGEFAIGLGVDVAGEKISDKLVVQSGDPKRETENIDREEASELSGDKETPSKNWLYVVGLALVIGLVVTGKLRKK